MGKKQAILLLILTTGLFSVGRAQDLRPEGEFLTAGLKVGEPISYSLKLRHPSDTEVLFPDSAYDYSPFELVEKYFFTTRTDETGESLDSAIYVLTTFETDSLLRLGLPVFVLRNSDTTTVRSAFSEVKIIPELLVSADSAAPALIDNTNYVRVKQAVNLPLLGGILLGLLILLVILYFVFGERIRKNIRLRRMKTRYERFLSDYQKESESREITVVEHRLALWKEYCERLIAIPFTSYTTKEIGEAVADDKLYTALRDLDRIIYGGATDSPEMLGALAFLEQYAGQTYDAKVKEVRNA